MEKNLEILFLTEILYKCDFAFSCIERLNKHKFNFPGSNASVFEAIFSYLHYTSNVSLILWPYPKGRKSIKEKRMARGSYLRQILLLPEEHLLSDRKFRDHIAHMDERIDDWWGDSERHNIARLTVGTRNAISAFNPKEVFEYYIPAEKVFFFRGDEINIQESVNALQDIKVRAGHRIQALMPQFPIANFF